MSINKLFNMKEDFRSYSGSLALTEALSVMNKLIDGSMRSVEVSFKLRFEQNL